MSSKNGDDITTPRFFVLRELEIDPQDIRIGDIYRITGANVPPNAFFMANANAQKSEDPERGEFDLIASQLVQITPTGVEYNLPIKPIGFTKN